MIFIGCILTWTRNDILALAGAVLAFGSFCILVWQIWTGKRASFKIRGEELKISQTGKNFGLWIMNDGASPFYVHGIQLLNGKGTIVNFSAKRNVNAGETQYFTFSLTEFSGSRIKIAVIYDKGKKKKSDWIYL